MANRATREIGIEIGIESSQTENYPINESDSLSEAFATLKLEIPRLVAIQVKCLNG
jgi:hypothetical protein